MSARTAVNVVVRTATKFTTAPLRTAARSSTIKRSTITPPTRAFSISAFAQEKRYTQEHEWIELDPNGGDIATIGISTYAAKALGDVVYVELPEIDSHHNAGDTIGAVESVKSASDIMTPVAGTITETNGALEEKPGHINKEPEGERGWLAKIKVDDKSQVEKCMDAEAYAKFVDE